MRKANALAGLIGNYGDSDDDSDDGMPVPSKQVSASRARQDVDHQESYAMNAAASIHPAPVPHCPWSACYDESSGYTYYWNQNTNAVTWEAPPEYLLALKLAQQHLQTSAGSEVSAEEWQLYQQALAEKQNAQSKPVKYVHKAPLKYDKNATSTKEEKHSKQNKKRSMSEEEEMKIEPITSFHNSDSESNDEQESPVKKVVPTKPIVQTKPSKNPHKKQKTKAPIMEYGPTLPPNQEYTVPIGPELPPENTKKVENNGVKEEDKKSTKSLENEDSQDDDLLLKKLKDKAKLLEKLGGEIPSELQKIIRDETRSRTQSPKVADDNSGDSKIDTNIDDLLEEIEKKELPKAKSKLAVDLFNNEKSKSQKNSPSSTPPLEESTALFPSSKNIETSQENSIEPKPGTPPLPEKKENVYLMEIDRNELVNTNRKKLRISNSVLPIKKSDVPSYTTKYSTHIEGFSTERTGLGFKQDDDVNSKNAEESSKTISYGNGLMFTKGETLNEDKKDDDLDDMADLVEAKLKYLNQVQPSAVTPVQEMLIQLQTLVSAFRGGYLAPAYWRRWVSAAEVSLAHHEATAAPPGWTCTFLRYTPYSIRDSESLSDGLSEYTYQTNRYNIGFKVPPYSIQNCESLSDGLGECLYLNCRYKIYSEARLSEYEMLSESFL